MSAAPPTLEALRCDQCGAMVPLGEGDTTCCLCCGAAVEVPPEHRALREADRAGAAARAEAAALYRRLGRPPGAVTRALGSSVLFVVMMGLYLPTVAGLALALMSGINVIERATRGNFYEVVSDSVRIGYLIGGAYLMFGVPILFGTLARRRTGARHRLQARLAARPPDHPGGAARCRGCGAALDVPAGAFGVRCLYCHADNLVRVPAALCEALRGDEKDVRSTMASAIAEEAKARRQAVRVGLLRFLMVTPLVGFLIALFEGGQSRWHPIWQESMREPRQLWSCYGEECRSAGNGASVPLGERVTLQCPQFCRYWYDVALAAGERLEVSVEAVPPGAAAPDIIFSAKPIASILRPMTRLGETRQPSSDEPAILVAPHSAWFNIKINTSYSSRPYQLLMLRARLIR